MLYNAFEMNSTSQFFKILPIMSNQCIKQSEFNEVNII
jgi:hypothetical protein